MKSFAIRQFLPPSFFTWADRLGADWHRPARLLAPIYIFAGPWCYLRCCFRWRCYGV